MTGMRLFGILKTAYRMVNVSAGHQEWMSGTFFYSFFVFFDLTIL